MKKSIISGLILLFVEAMEKKPSSISYHQSPSRSDFQSAAKQSIKDRIVWTTDGWMTITASSWRSGSRMDNEQLIRVLLLEVARIHPVLSWASLIVKRLTMWRLTAAVFPFHHASTKAKKARNETRGLVMERWNRPPVTFMPSLPLASQQLLPRDQ